MKSKKNAFQSTGKKLQATLYHDRKSPFQTPYKLGIEGRNKPQAKLKANHANSKFSTADILETRGNPND